MFRRVLSGRKKGKNREPLRKSHLLGRWFQRGVEHGDSSGGCNNCIQRNITTKRDPSEALLQKAKRRVFCQPLKKNGRGKTMFLIHP